ncbi:MAG: C40 family peptidase [Clostridiales bacterium]|nr:C40 family peptidase [Clostridiales bacterium]
MNYRLINIVSGVVAAGIAVGCVTAYTCGSAKEIDLQSPALLGDEAVSFEELFYGQDLQAEETAYIPMSMGNFDINDYTIIAVSSYSDIASEFGTDPSDPITYDGNTYWVVSDAVLVSAKTEKNADEEGDEDADADTDADTDEDNDNDENEDVITELKIGDAVTRISYTREWSFIKLANGQQGYVLSTHLSSTKVEPEKDEDTDDDDDDEDTSSSSQDTDTPSNNNDYYYDDDDYDEPSNDSSSSDTKDYEEWDVDFTVYSTTALNARSGPGISYTLLFTLSIGSEIHVIAETDNGWYKSDDGYYVKASYTSETKPEPTPVPTSSYDSGSEDWSDFASYIRSFIGCRYVYGGASPDGFDCSGFVMYCYQTYYNISLPHGATSQSYCGYEVSLDEIQVGDIICFDKNGDGTMEHSALYVGNGKYVHAQSTATGVVESSMAYASGIAHIRRVL